MKKLILFFLFTVALISCDSTDPGNNDVYSADKFFPKEIGNKWEYYFSGWAESAIIEWILKTNITHEDGSNIWGYTEVVKVNYPDSSLQIAGYYAIKPEGIYYYSSDKDTMIAGTNILCEKELALKSPVTVGTEWITNEGAASRIVSIGNLVVLNNRYSQTVLVVSEKNATPDNSWFALNIGFVKRVQHYGIGQPYSSITKWELRNYSLL